MRRLLAVVGVTLALGCGGAFGGPNLAACEAFVAHYQQLDCTWDGLGDRRRPDANCVVQLDWDDCDLAPWFACLEAQLECQDGVLTGDIDACGAPCAPAP